MRRNRALHCVGVSLALSLTASLGAAVTVTTTADDGSAGSLRGVIATAPPGETVIVPEGVYRLTIDHLAVDKSLTFIGDGADRTFIEGGAEPDPTSFRVFFIDAPGAAVVFEDLTIRNGGGQSSFGGSDGGLLRVQDASSVTARRCTFTGDESGCCAVDINAGDLTLIDCELSDMRSPDTPSGLSFSGGAGTLEIQGCLFADIAAGMVDVGAGADAAISDTVFLRTGGRAIGNSGAMALVDCTITDCRYAGISNHGVLNVIGSTVARNLGGGIINTEILFIANSTICDNLSDGGGGGIRNHVAAASLNAEGVTIVNNVSGGDGGGIFNTAGAAATLRSCLVAGNVDLAIPTRHHDLSGDFTSGGHNLIGNNQGHTGIVNGVNGDRVMGAGIYRPRLGPLDDNGGPTPTRAPLPDSLVIDAGSSTRPDDQRGVSRPVDGDGDAVAQDDIGAVEFNPDLAFRLTPVVLAFDFEEWPVNAGPTLTVMFTVVNSGRLPISGSQAALGGADADQFEIVVVSFGNDIEPGEVRSLGIVYDPDEIAAHTAALEWTSPDLSAPLTIPLTGTGTEFIGPTGLTTGEIVDHLVGIALLAPDRVDVNDDTLEDAADVSSNVNFISPP